MMSLSATATEVARSWRRRYDTVGALEWEPFLRRIGLACDFQPLPASLPAALVDSRRVVVRSGLSCATTALLVWHEVGHFALHAGGVGFWGSCHGGTFLLSRFERQAWSFALTFPAWTCEAIAEAVAGLAELAMPRELAQLLFH